MTVSIRNQNLMEKTFIWSYVIKKTVWHMNNDCWWTNWYLTHTHCNFFGYDSLWRHGALEPCWCLHFLIGTLLWELATSTLLSPGVLLPKNWCSERNVQAPFLTVFLQPSRCIVFIFIFNKVWFLSYNYWESKRALFFIIIWR